MPRSRAPRPGKRGPQRRPHGQIQRRPGGAQQRAQQRAQQHRRAGLAAGAIALAVLTTVFAVIGSRGHHGGSAAAAGARGAVAGSAADRAAYDPATRKLNFDLPAFAGGRVSETSLSGKPTVINFYASWCTVCKGELPAFQAAAQRIGGRVNFLGVNPQSNDTDGDQAAMIRAAGVTYPTARDSGDGLLRLFDTTGSLPVTVFVRADGTVVDVHLGGLTGESLGQLLHTDLGVPA